MTLDTPIDKTAALCAELLSFGSAVVFDAQGRIGALASAIKPIFPGMTIAGPAFTCQCEPGDNLTLHAAMKMAQPGDVLACDAMGATEQGMFGDVMASCAMGRRLAGLVTDGGVRDRLVISEVGFPVFAANICMKGTVKEYLGPLNRPITLSGVHVNPGDLIIGDEDGVVVVVRDRAEEVLKACRIRAAREGEIKAAVASGQTPWDINDLGGTLRAQGISIEI
ncbi:MAG: 4-carboxy-4-hydroxy-2-oxoadipate aldolase/oxaloacetate decarboxylase [Jhaorihella sp.]